MRLRIQTKLFLTMLAAVSAVVVAMFLVTRWNFNRGFSRYVHAVDLARLDALAGNLEEAYAQEGSWRFVRDDPARWRRMLLESVPESLRDFRREGRPGRGARRMREGPGPGPPPRGGFFGRRVVLLDRDRHRVLGPPGLAERAELKPLRSGGRTVGYLGLLPPTALADIRQSRFVREQRHSFAVIALGMVLLAALLSVPLARRMVRRIRGLAAATHRLASGEYGTRVPVESSDELGRLARDFNDLALTLEKNEQARRQWIADISHELRTPLSVLRGEIEALQDGVREITPKTVAALHGEVMRLTRIVSDLYELSLSDMGALTYRKDRVDLAAVLRLAAEQYRPEFEEAGIALALDSPPGREVPVFGDAERLHQLFANLLENSRRYTDAGGSLRVRIGRIGDRVRVDFEDSAPGVPDAERARLFERFYRVERSRSRSTGGVGLGLAICRNIVEAHGGTIEALASPSGGLWVKVELPWNG